MGKEDKEYIYIYIYIYMYVHNGVLLSHKKRVNEAICNTCVDLAIIILSKTEKDK